MSKRLTVIVINSLSYTGTTWLNCVLGAHARAFALGPPDRVFALRHASERDSCRVHGPACEFWARFWAGYRADDNFFLQLAAHAGADVIVINNPIANRAGVELRHHDIDLRQVQLIRDGRALAASYRRHNAGNSYLDAIAQFLFPSFHGFYFDADDPDRLCLRYEDMLAEPWPTLQRLGAFAGIAYEQSALRFWESQQHVSAGNAGTISLIRAGQGLPTGAVGDAEFYREQFQRMRESGPGAFEDSRWQSELTPRERFLFDLFCGAANARFGYERDRFTLPEVSRFTQEVRALLSDPKLPGHGTDLIAIGRAALAGVGEVEGGDVPPMIGSCVRPLREALHLGSLRRSGLHLTASQLRRLSRAAGLGIGAGMVAALALWSVL